MRYNTHFYKYEKLFVFLKMSHRQHHYQNDFGEPAITVILIVALGMALAMCRYWCKEARNERRELRRQRLPRTSGRRRGRTRSGDVITHHLVLQMPSSIDSIEGGQLTQSPIEFTTSAPRYSLVMQNPSLFTALPKLIPIRPPGVPETPPPPYPVTPPMSHTIVETIPEEDPLEASRERKT